MKNLLIAQSGGPTAAINSTLVGALTYAYMESERVGTVYGAINGIEGVFNENFINLSDKIRNSMDMDLLTMTPSSALGSCRYKLNSAQDKEEKMKKIIDTLRKYDIGYFIYIGGNDSMDTVDKLHKYCNEHGIDDIKIVGAPKTIDNDLSCIDHCPGFGSAAKYIAITFSELMRDISVYNTQAVTIVEVMGRNTGWLTAASALSSSMTGHGPSLIYLCETAFSIEQFVSDVKKALEKKSSIMIAISEGIKDKDGKYISEGIQSDEVDSFGHKYISGAAKVLEDIVRKEIGCKVRSIELNLMQRCSSHTLSKTDIEESKLLGMKACQCAVNGKSGVMSTIIRKSDSPYTTEFSYVDVSKVANFEKKVPREWINEEGNGVNEEMINYIRPLIEGEVIIKKDNGIPHHMILY